jgi:uncharacterized membrane protein YfcA
MDPLIILFGLGVGVLIGVTGIGGGSLMTPLLILVFGTQPVVAIGTDLAYGAVTKTVGGWRHLRSGNVDLSLSWWLASGSVPGALVGVWIIDYLHRALGDDFDQTLLIALSGALLLAAAGVLIRGVFMTSAAAKERESAILDTRGRIMAVVTGLVLGFILGLTSVGSGALIGMVLILAFKLTPRRVVGTDVFHAAILLWVAGFAHFVAGNVDLVLMTNILLGSVPGVWLGAALLNRIPQHGLRPVLGVVLLAAAVGVLTKAGIGVPLPVFIGIPLAVGALVWLLLRRRRRVALEVL